MLIEDKPIKHWIENFYGYGSWYARIWFVSYEEGGGELPEEVAEKLNHFYSQQESNERGTLCDIREMYRHVSFRIEGPKANLFTTLHEYRFGKDAIQNGVWKNLIAFEHGYKNKKLPDMLTYQKNSFAIASAQNEALIKLYPLPAPHSHAWYYSWLDLPQFSFLKSRISYQEHLYDNRIHTILSNIKIHKPNLVLMYGMNNINTLKKSIQQYFEGAKFKMVKAIKEQIPQYHHAECNGTTILITTQIPALRHNRIETGFDWQAFGKTVRSEI
jgi:hypothetical protein